MMTDELLKTIFNKNKKCVINTDLDGLISGMLLQRFLNWEVVGFSSCCGKQNDNLWLKDKNLSLKDLIFVDLPVALKSISTIDQHFVAFEKESIDRYNDCANKLNPNIIRARFFKNNDYTKKYPFGTAHFILASLEKLNLIPENFEINFYKNLGNYDLCDLLLRADRVVGNTYLYTQNCFDWSNWMIDYGGKITKNLFNIVKSEYKERHNREKFVESQMLRLGCAGLDGECSNLFRKKDIRGLLQYFNFLSSAFNMDALPIFDFYSYDNLYGERIRVENNNFDHIKELLKQKNMFSYAFVNMRTLSVTYKKGGKDE